MSLVVFLSWSVAIWSLLDGVPVALDQSETLQHYVARRGRSARAQASRLEEKRWQERQALLRQVLEVQTALARYYRTESVWSSLLRTFWGMRSPRLLELEDRLEQLQLAMEPDIVMSVSKSVDPRT
ncbi:uncharacterized protein MONBRDRAFT_7306 [Monosiga brevicollis MX1]|uniref:Biogenesis of lysosome-related organelles complex 1 subunit 1 n=1 Tax=Monosiga brevicollis TaxID=81824 RepID=A9UWJ9_MONBE|nr:uncharacterized protein MONBRDRAFT_7306 [Monosiga brevicollis MX1]EDQ90058.1 predicted protein [Monosiga brevicollis MX1]|eukprot:XP_001744825.1 hypothetical protein [Monosiga brevicollis MX1]